MGDGVTTSDSDGSPDELVSDDAIATDVKRLSALGYETRYRLVRLLVEADGTMDFCQISPHVEVSDSAVSHALTTLCDAGLVQKHKDGRSRKYRATQCATALVTVLDGSR